MPFLRAVVEDVLAAVTHVHVSGKMHEMVLGDIGRQATNYISSEFWFYYFR